VNARNTWSWAAVGVTAFAVAAITGIMGAVSYEHEYQLARRHGQAPWVSSLLPFTVDGMILAASVVILWANSQGIRRPVRPLLVLAVGVGATIAANLAAGIGDGWLGAAVSAWSGVALILISDVAMWLLGTLRALSKGEAVRPAAACSHPPPPITLAEALPLARARLQEEGEPFGKEALAARFKTTPHQVRLALAPAVDRGQGGAFPGTKGTALATQDPPAGTGDPPGAVPAGAELQPSNGQAGHG
jgi:uncharacterized protein DUF2637